MYKLYIGEILAPVMPSKITWKYTSGNKTTTLINIGDVNILKPMGLTEFSFDLLIPSQKYPFAFYEGDFLDPKHYLEKISDIVGNKKVILFRILRNSPKGEFLFDNVIKCTIEDYSVKEDAKDGFDIVLSLTFRQYRDFGTAVLTSNSDGTVTPKKERNTEGKVVPTKENPKSYTVVSGDTLWGICKKELNDGERYKAIAELNGISNPNKVNVGQVIKLE